MTDSLSEECLNAKSLRYAGAITELYLMPQSIFFFLNQNSILKNRTTAMLKLALF